MKVMVMERFKDKYTDEVRDLGCIFECSEERLAEIQSVSSNLVRVVKDEPKVESVTEEVKEKEPAKKSTRKRTTKSASDKGAEEPKKGEE